MCTDKKKGRTGSVVDLLDQHLEILPGQILLVVGRVRVLDDLKSLEHHLRFTLSENGFDKTGILSGAQSKNGSGKR